VKWCDAVNGTDDNELTLCLRGVGLPRNKCA
jgi:hypothetical protein